MATPPATMIPGQPQLTYVDRPEVSETFAHSLRRLTIDGVNIHLEFVVNRMDDPNPPAPLSGKAVTVARLVMPLAGMFDLYNNLTGIVRSLRANQQMPPETRTVN